MRIARPTCSWMQVTLKRWSSQNYDNLIRRLRYLAQPSLPQPGKPDQFGRRPVQPRTKPHVVAIQLPSSFFGDGGSTVSIYMWMVPFTPCTPPCTNKMPEASSRLYLLGYTGPDGKHYLWGKKDKDPTSVALYNTWKGSDWDNTVPSINYASLKAAEMKVEKSKVAESIVAFSKSPASGMVDRAKYTASLATVLAEAVRFECIQTRVREALWPLVPMEGSNKEVPFLVNDLAITDPGDAYYITLAQAQSADPKLKFVSVVDVRSNWDKVAAYNLKQGRLFYVGITNTQLAQAQLANPAQITGSSRDQPTRRRKSVKRRQRTAPASGADTVANGLPAAGFEPLDCTGITGSSCAASAA